MFEMTDLISAVEPQPQEKSQSQIWKKTLHRNASRNPRCRELSLFFFHLYVRRVSLVEKTWIKTPQHKCKRDNTITITTTQLHKVGDWLFWPQWENLVVSLSSSVVALFRCGYVSHVWLLRSCSGLCSCVVAIAIDLWSSLCCLCYCSWFLASGVLAVALWL